MLPAEVGMPGRALDARLRDQVPARQATHATDSVQRAALPGGRTLSADARPPLPRYASPFAPAPAPRTP
jgi:hypothetical protein